MTYLPGARAVLALVLPLGLLATGGCGSTQVDGPGPALEGEVVVLAASSLTGPFQSIAKAFEVSHPGVQVVLSFDGSSTLAGAILEGAPGDVFASADDASMGRLTTANATATAPITAATNGLEVAVAPGNPLRIRGLADLRDPQVTVALCLPEVPCGAYAAEAFQRAGLTVPPAGREPNVKAVLTKVQLGEADAGLVYRTDVRAAPEVGGVELPASVQVTVRYPVAVLTSAAHPRAAAAFVNYLVTAAAQRILRAAGFGRP